MIRREFLAQCAGVALTVPLVAQRANDVVNAVERSLQTGVNLGRWLSQYDRKSPQFDTYIQEKDIARIATWGLDHVRLPVDCDFFETAPGQYDQSRLDYVDRAIGWAHKRGLKFILDLHSAPGYFFGNVGRNELFTSAEMQQRFLAIWNMFGKRYRAHGDFLLFEILNEVVEPKAAQWNALIARAVSAIRAADSKRWIVTGGTQYSSIDTLKDLTVPPDERIIYTFHYYKPTLFTHQRAGWNAEAMRYAAIAHNSRVDYPGPIPHMANYAAAYPKDRDQVALAGRTINRDWIRESLKPALDFRARTGRAIHCGEFGVIANAPPDSAARWYADFCGLLAEHCIPRTAWTYKCSDFGIIDPKSGAVVNPGVLRAMRAKW